jgi:hypothetical protein
VQQVLDAQTSVPSVGLDDPWTVVYGLVGILSLLLRDVARASSLLDVNVAAGAARQDLASLLSGRELAEGLGVDLVDQPVEETGEVIDLALETG